MTFRNGINLAAIVDRARRGGVTGLRLGAEHVLGESTAHVPIEERTLQDSGRVSTDEAGLRAAVSYDTPYAVVQHEDMSLQHDSGRTAKYLENAFNTQRPVVAQVIATAVRREIGS